MGIIVIQRSEIREQWSEIRKEQKAGPSLRLKNGYGQDDGLLWGYEQP